MDRHQNRSFAGYVPANYLPPYGAKLTPADFRYVNTPGELSQPLNSDLVKDLGLRQFWEAAGETANGKPINYTIATTDSETAYGFANSQPIQFEDPATLLMHRVGTPLDWYDWILRQGAKKDLPNLQPEWLGNSVEAQMHRIEFKITIDSHTETNTNNFSSVSEFQEWLDKAKQPSSADLRVYKVIPNPKAATLALVHNHWEPGETNDLVLEKLERLNLKSRPRWFRMRMELPDEQPALFVRLEGSKVANFCGWVVVPVNKLQQNAKLVGATEGSDRVTEVSDRTAESSAHATAGSRREDRGKWWAVEVVGTGLALVFPSKGVNLRLAVDIDGGSLSMIAAATDARTPVLLTSEIINREWGKWLDPWSGLSATELADGITKAEQLLEATKPAEHFHFKGR